MGKYIDKILDSPIGSTIGFIALDYIVIATFIFILQKILEFILPSVANLPSSVATIVVSIIFLVIYIRYMRDRLQNLISTKNFKLALILVIPSLVIIIGNLVSNYIDGHFVFNYLVVISGLAPGITEEVVFRGFIVSNLMRIRKNKNLSIYLIVVLSAVPFGLLHLANIVMGADIPYSIVQAFFAICIGILFVAVYLRTGNLIVPIIIHSLIDMSGLCSSEFLSSDVTGLVSQAPVAYDFIFLFVMSIIMLGLGLYYVRKEKWADIDKEWDDIVIE